MHRLILIGAMCCIASLPFLIVPELGHQNASIERALSAFPSSMEAIDQFQKEVEEEFSLLLADYKAQLLENLDFQHAIVSWNQLIEHYFAACTKLSFLFLMMDDEATNTYAKQIAYNMGEKLWAACQDEEALSLMLSFIEKSMQDPEQLSLEERGALGTLLKSAIEGRSEDNALSQRAALLQEKLALQEMSLFTYRKGTYLEKQLPASGKMTVINWNVCFFNEGMSLLFGGVLPWQDRIQKVAAKIRSCDADIVCLQEMFSFEGTEDLYELLKKDYTHFYMHIGPKFYGFDVESLGLPSGLFVASRYPLKNAAFVPYNEKETQKIRGYGVFLADICNEENILARLATTHLQPGSGEENEQYRNAQIDAIVSYLRVTDIGDKPCFLCGDLNLEKKGEEYKRLCQNFINLHQGIEWTCCELRNYWYKAGRNAGRFQALGLEVEWIDYFLRLRSGYKTKVVGKTCILSVNDPRNPKAALSDHQILKTELIFPIATSNEK